MLGAFIASGANAIYVNAFDDLLGKNKTNSKFSISLLMISFSLGLLSDFLTTNSLKKHIKLENNTKLNISHGLLLVGFANIIYTYTLGPKKGVFN